MQALMQDGVPEFVMENPIHAPMQPLSESRALQLDRPAAASEPAMEPPLAPTFRRVLMPLDGSDMAESAIVSFLDVAPALELELVLLHVLPVLVPEPVEGSAQAIEAMTRRLNDEATSYLEATAARLADRAHVQTRVRIGDAATEIVEEASECRAHLIAMTTHGRSGMSRLFFGSVAESVLRRTTVPVFLKPVSDSQADRKAA